MPAAVETLTDSAKADINAKLTPEQKKQMLRDMIRVRRFEQATREPYSKKKMGGFLHLYIGQESVAVGTVSLMGDNDHIITAYRDHGHALAVGMSMDECMAELFGRASGCSKGKGGSMHFFAPDKHYWGGHGVVGGQTPLGLGLAFALKYKGVTGCCMTFLGDGAVNQGVYHESLNLASLWDLPVIYIIENNGYSMGTSQKRSSAFNTCLAERASGYGIIWDVVRNGSDIYEVREVTQRAIDRAHNESRPTVLEITTYRYYGHSVSDNAGYRTREEVEHYQKNYDPIANFTAKLIAEGLVTAEEAAAMDAAAQKEAEASVKFAEQSAFPTVDDIFSDVYWEVDHDTPAGNSGRHFFND
ncbi:MAG: pyruvate dehydrogenase (acetyl-transferring) E1 component subunit alpha [Verrucomicrobiales bacterium]